MQAKRTRGVWMGALVVAVAWALVLTSPTVHESCPSLASCSLLSSSWEVSPDRTVTSLSGDLSLPPPKVLPTPLDKPPR